MKITRRQLRKLISEMAMRDIAYLDGIDSEGADFEKVKKYTSSQLFAKKANRLYSEKMGFPGSDVWIRNFSRYTDLRAVDPQAGVLEPKTRAEFFEPTDKLLSALNVNPLEFDKSKDVCIVNISEAIVRGFLPTPHMIIHAILHGDYYWNYMTEEETVLPKCAAFSRQIHDMTESGEIPEDAFSSQTKSLRNDPINDNVPELLTAYFLNYRAAIIDIPGLPHLSRELDSKARECAQELRDTIRGKIAVVRTVVAIET